jgi:hypothetical protein
VYLQNPAALARRSNQALCGAGEAAKHMKRVPIKKAWFAWKDRHTALLWKHNAGLTATASNIFRISFFLLFFCSFSERVFSH